MTGLPNIPHTLTSVEGQRGVWVAGAGCVQQDVVGEAYNPQQMGRIMATLQGRTDSALVAWLMLEPDNPHDRNAVVVWVLGGKVGYLPRELAVTWAPALASLRARYAAEVACAARLDLDIHKNGGAPGVFIWLPSFAVAPQPAPAPAARPLPATPVQELMQVRAEIEVAKATLAALRAELGAVEEAVDVQSFGFYQPRYGFESSAQYVNRLKTVRDEQQALIKAGTATRCDTKWTVGGSATEGKKLVKNQSKLMLRAFNGECDAAIARVKYDNVTAMEERITKSCEAVNKLGAVQQVVISHRYFALKLAELRLVHEHREKVQEEKDEQRELKERMREEQKAQAEIDKAKAEAEKEEAATAAALERARAEMAAAEATSKQHEKLESLVARLETELSAALDRKAKAIARAQLTRSGHVYVLSNVGSFGHSVYKIGMTRRLDPFERVAELGDASVPFPFDVHAIIFCEDAPGLENKLHAAFAARRVNLVNHRKEYFRVTLDEIRGVVQQVHGALVTFALEPEAEEYRKTVSAREAPTTPPKTAPDAPVEDEGAPVPLAEDGDDDEA